MADLTLKKIGEVLDKKLDQKLNPIHKKLDEHSIKLDSLTLDMIEVQRKTDVLKDIQSYIEDTKGKVDDHEERIQSLESTA